MRSATVGQFLVNETLPEELRDYERVLDKKSMTSLLQEVIEAHPMTSREHTGRRSNNPELLNTSGFFHKVE